MARYLRIAIAFLVTFVIASCQRSEPQAKHESTNTPLAETQSTPQQISNDDVLRLLRAEKHMPLCRYAEITFGVKSQLSQEANRLIAEGFFKPSSGQYEREYEPTEKGKPLVAHGYFNALAGGGFWRLQACTHKIDLTRIVDRRANARKDTLEVIYEGKVSATPYLEQLRRLDRPIVDEFVERARTLGSVPDEGTYTATAVLQKWETGWRVAKQPANPQ